MLEFNAGQANFQSVHHLFGTLLGREPQGIHEVSFYAERPMSETIGRLVSGGEFAKEIELPLKLSGFVSASRFRGEPTWRLVRWLREAFPLKSKSVSALEQVDNWRTLLRVLWSDEGFRDALVDSKFDRARIGAFCSALELTEDSKLALTGSVHPQMIDGRATFVDIGRVRLPHQMGRTTDVLRNMGKLTGIRAETQGYSAYQPDPQMAVQLSLRKGTYVFCLKGKFFHANGAPVGADKAQCYLDFGDGYTESQSFVFPIRNGRLAVNGILNLTVPIKAFRFDPADIACKFDITDFSLAEVPQQPPSASGDR